MAMYTDPQTGERREIDDFVRPTESSTFLSLLVLMIGVALAAAYLLYSRSDPVSGPAAGVSAVEGNGAAPASAALPVD